MLFAEVALPDTFYVGLVGSAAFGLLGIVLLLLGFFGFEVVTRKLNVQEQLEKGNVAVGIVVGALLLAVAYIAAHVVH